MRTHGTLSRWNDDRGFGFIAPAAGGADIFVHISAFPRDGVRPRVGELISYEVEPGKDGKPRAMRIMRPGTARRPRPARAAPRGSHRPRRSGGMAGALLLAAIAGYMYFSQPRTEPATPAPPAALAAPSVASDQGFSCDGRTRCPQMRSCTEAKYFLKHCPRTTMDGDHDGVPCESQWCSGSSGFLPY